MSDLLEECADALPVQASIHLAGWHADKHLGYSKHRYRERAAINTCLICCLSLHFKNVCCVMQASSFIYDDSIVKSLFDEAPARYQDRIGGYCRVILEPQPRRGDSTEMAAIELL